MSLPRYRQLAAALRADITEGRYGVGDHLPPEMELCQIYAASRHTVRDALRLLREAGLVQRRRGAGTTVIANEVAPSFVQPLGGPETLTQYAREAKLIVRAANPRALTLAEADRIKAMPGQIWLVIEGVRRAASEPVAVSSLFVPLEFAAIVTSLEGWDGAIHQLIARDFQVHTRRIEQEIAAETLDTATARTLKAEKGSAGLRTLRRYFDSQDNLVLATDSTHPSGRFVYAMTYRLDS
jgi:DNA-binding GntR family transcriptional regulator